MKKIWEYILNWIFILSIFGIIALLCYPIQCCINRDDKLNNYCSEFEIHYLDGKIDTVYVIGNDSYDKKPYFDGGGFMSPGDGYVFCGIQGVTMVKLLNTHKSKDYNYRIYFKNK